MAAGGKSDPQWIAGADSICSVPPGLYNFEFLHPRIRRISSIPSKNASANTWVDWPCESVLIRVGRESDELVMMCGNGVRSTARRRLGKPPLTHRAPAGGQLNPTPEGVSA
jgi:hypothetical protein